MIENTILSNLVFNEDYCRKVIPFIKDEYFTGAGNKIVFSIISDYVDKYCLLYTSPSPRDVEESRMPSSA